jgi:cell division transport system permease protein
MKQWLQHHRYALQVTLRRLMRAPFSFLTNVGVIAFALVLPLMGASILISVQPVAQHVSADPTMTIFMAPDTSIEVAETLAKRIEDTKDPLILNVQLIDKAQAAAALRSNDAWRQALEALPDNPLPHAITVTLAADDAVARTAELFATQWRQSDGVQFVQLDSLWVQRLEALLRLVRIGLTLVTLIIALVVLAAVFNTVRMQALSQRDEIAVARLVGATESFVRRPFLYQGGLTCGLGAAIAIGLTALALKPLNEAVGDLSKTYDTLFALHLPSTSLLLLYLLAAIVLGCFSARWSVTRHTRF